MNGDVGEEDDEVDDGEADEEANQYHSEEIYNHDLPIIANFSSKLTISSSADDIWTKV